MKKDKRLIPSGYYCYSDKGNCPYWSIRKGKRKMENGYCAFLEKGDWDINSEKVWTMKIKNEKGKYEKIAEGTAKQLGIQGSCLWDQVKECGIKYEITKTGPSSLKGAIKEMKKDLEIIKEKTIERKKKV